jgi:hypothetical protein
MGYQSRKRNYKSRRERYERDKRNAKVILVFAAIGLLVWLIMTRHEWWGYVKTFFY